MFELGRSQFEILLAIHPVIEVLDVLSTAMRESTGGGVDLEAALGLDGSSSGTLNSCRAAALCRIPELFVSAGTTSSAH